MGPASESPAGMLLTLNGIRTVTEYWLFIDTESHTSIERMTEAMIACDFFSI
jgi:hypothetical protein